jgi:hypothetical protein
MNTWLGARSGGEAFVLHPQLPPEPQEDFATVSGSAASVEQLPVLHPPEVDVFVLQQPMMYFLIYEEVPRKRQFLC